MYKATIIWHFLPLVVTTVNSSQNLQVIKADSKTLDKMKGASLSCPQSQRYGMICTSLITNTSLGCAISEDHETKTSADGPSGSQDKHLRVQGSSDSEPNSTWTHRGKHTWTHKHKHKSNFSVKYLTQNVIDLKPYTSGLAYWLYQLITE